MVHSTLDIKFKPCSMALAIAAISGFSGSAMALDLEEVVVTGVPGGPANAMDTSISVSSLNSEDMMKASPRNTAEIFRSLPGIRSESSSGGGNSNLSVRGMPLSTGGAKFISVHEDGLPVMMFGDFDFAPSDGFYKADANLQRVESVRGGTASTLTVNGPGGIINFINKTGEEGGGSFAFTHGLDFDDEKIDFSFGDRLTDTVYFHIGGHYQSGGDVRDVGYTFVDGGQVRLSVTKEYDNGFLRASYKKIDKKDGIFMPQLTAICGNELCDAIGGFEAQNDVINSPYLLSQPSIRGDRTFENKQLSDGFYVKSDTFSLATEFDLGNELIFSGKAKIAEISGKFRSTFGHNAFDADTLAAGAAMTYANGPDAGEAVTSASLMALNGNPFISQQVGLDANFNDMGNAAFDLRLSKSFELDAGSIDVTAGFFYMTQEFNQDWSWNQYYTDVTGDEAALIDIDGITDNGFLGYGNGFDWSGNARAYDVTYTNSAPFLSVTGVFGRVTVDASVREDTLDAQGIALSADAAGALAPDVDGDGVIEPQEMSISLTNSSLAGSQFVNDDVSNTAFSLGLNVGITDDLAGFVRYSEGAAFNSERQYFNGSTDMASGKIVAADNYIDETEQLEVGLKWQSPVGVDLFITYFSADTEENNFSITDGAVVQEYEAQGVEVEFGYGTGGFELNGSFTITDAEIANSVSDPMLNGNVPKRQADWIFSVTPSYSIDDLGEMGLNITGTDDMFAGFENQFVMPGYTTVNLFVNWWVTENLTLSVNVNNLLDEEGWTEAGDGGRFFDIDGDSNVDHTVARSISGTTSTATLSYKFD